MHRNDAISRSDRDLLVALAIILATVSGTLGSALSYRPNTLFKSNPTVAPAPQSAQDVVLTQLIAEHRCLSEALYYEARGEGRTGEQAVAEVVFHRLNARNYGHSICAVVYEGSSRPGCQFSFTCNGDLHRPREEFRLEGIRADRGANPHRRNPAAQCHRRRNPLSRHLGQSVLGSDIEEDGPDRQSHLLSQ